MSAYCGLTADQTAAVIAAQTAIRRATAKAATTTAAPSPKSADLADRIAAYQATIQATLKQITAPPMVAKAAQPGKATATTARESADSAVAEASTYLTKWLEGRS